MYVYADDGHPLFNAVVVDVAEREAIEGLHLCLHLQKVVVVVYTPSQTFLIATINHLNPAMCQQLRYISHLVNSLTRDRHRTS